MNCLITSPVLIVAGLTTISRLYDYKPETRSRIILKRSDICLGVLLLILAAYCSALTFIKRPSLNRASSMGQMFVLADANEKAFSECFYNARGKGITDSDEPLALENSFICRYLITATKSEEGQVLEHLANICVKDLSADDRVLVDAQASLAEKCFCTYEAMDRKLLYRDNEVELVFVVTKDIFDAYTLYVVKTGKGPGATDVDTKMPDNSQDSTKKHSLSQ